MEMDPNIKIIDPDKARKRHNHKTKKNKERKNSKSNHEKTGKICDGKVAPLPPPPPPAKESLLKQKTSPKSLKVSIPIKALKSKQLIRWLESNKNNITQKPTPMKSEFEDIEKSRPIYKKHIMPVVPSPSYHKYSSKPFKYDACTITEIKKYSEKGNQTDIKEFNTKDTQTDPVHLIDETEFKLMKDIKLYDGDISKLIALAKAENNNPQSKETTVIDSVQEKKKVDEEVINQVLRYSESNKAIISKVLNIANIVETRDPRRKKENREFFGNMITQILNRSTGTEYNEEVPPTDKILQLELSQINPDNRTNSNQNNQIPNNQDPIPSQSLTRNELLWEQHKKQTNEAPEYHHGQNVPNLSIYRTREYPQAFIDSEQNASFYKSRIPAMASQGNSYGIGYTALPNTNQYEKNLNAQKQLPSPVATRYFARKRQNLGPDINRKQPKHISQYISYQQKMRAQQTHSMNLQLKHVEQQENQMGHLHQQLQVVPLHQQAVPSYKQSSPVLHQTSPIFNQSPQYLNQRPQAQFCQPPTQISNQTPQILLQPSSYPNSIPSVQQQQPRSSNNYSVLSREQAMELQQKVWQSHLSNYPNADWSSALWSANRT